LRIKEQETRLTLHEHDDDDDDDDDVRFAVRNKKHSSYIYAHIFTYTMYSVLHLVLQNAHFQSLLYDAFSPIQNQTVQILGALIQPEINLVVCHLKFA